MELIPRKCNTSYGKWCVEYESNMYAYFWRKKDAERFINNGCGYVWASFTNQNGGKVLTPFWTHECAEAWREETMKMNPDFIQDWSTRFVLREDTIANFKNSVRKLEGN